MCEGVVKILRDQRADLLRLRVIRIIETRAEHIGADQHASFYFIAKPSRACLGIHVLQASAIRQIAQTIAHAIIAGEVGRRLGRRDNVVRWQRVFGVRQADVDDFRARILQPGDAIVPALRDFRVHSVHAVFFGNPDFLAGQIRVQSAFPIGHRHIEAGGILRIKARHRAQHNRAVARVARHRACLVEAAGKGDHAPARAAAVCGLDPGNAGEGRRLAD